MNLAGAKKIKRYIAKNYMTIKYKINKLEVIKDQSDMNYNKLTSEQERVIIHKATEAPFTGEYDDFYEDGTFICRRCNAPLFTSKSKFDAGCGWPSFDETLPNAVRRIPDPDGMRTEIECNNCGGHLGHEFLDEGLTDKNTRECVNSLSICFVPKDKGLPRIRNE